MLSQEEHKKLQDDFIQKVNESSYNQYKDKIITTGRNPIIVSSNKPILKKLTEELSLTNKEIIYMTIHGIEDTAQHRFCPVCGNVNTIQYVNDGYKKYCSQKCANSDPERIKRSQETMKERYGTSHAMQSQKFKDKRNETCIEKYGVSNPWSAGSEFRAKSEETMKDRYGVDNYSKTGVSSIAAKNIFYDKLLEVLSESNIEVVTTREEYYDKKPLKYRCKVCGSSRIKVNVKQREFVCYDCKENELIKEREEHKLVLQAKTAAKKIEREEYLKNKVVVKITLEQLKKIQDEFIQNVYNSSFMELKDKIKIDCENPFGVSTNKPMFKQLTEELNVTQKEILYMIIHGIEETAKHKFCPVCGDTNKIERVSTGYNEFCCYECSMKSGLVKERSSNTMMEKYGVPHAMQAQQFKDKQEAVWLEKYGYKNPWSDPETRKKSEETSIERYGVPFASQNPEHMQKIRDGWIEKYGFDNPMKNKEISSKMTQSKIENGTMNTSKPEENAYAALQKYFPEVIRQYKEKRYPFHCDFYIPSEDLFIELNYYWTHGYEPFDPNNEEHLKRIAEFKERSEYSDVYASAIYVWTQGDPLKKRTLVENNLNHLIFYNEDQFDEWIKTLKILK